MPPFRRRRSEAAVSFSTSLLALTLAAGAPAVAAVVWLAPRAGLTGPARWWLTGGVLAAWLLGAVATRLHVVRPLQTLANVLAALRAGDFSFRIRAPDPGDALGLALHEANLLTEVLRDQRLRAVESAALLRRVLAEIDVAIFAFDEAGRLRLLNRQGERLIARRGERSIGETAAALGLDVLLRDAEPALAGGPGPRVVQATFPGGTGRWEVRRGEFRQGGRPHALLLVTDLSEALRAEERQAWQRLVRVLSHEINNSLAPIKTIAGSLRRRVRAAAADGAARVEGTATPPAPWADDDFAHGLGVVAERAESLGRFIGAYARLTRLPPPAKRPVDVAPLVQRIAALEPRVAVVVRAGPAVIVQADPDQVEQLLLNLLRNAADAVIEAASDGVGHASGAPFPDGAATAAPGVTVWWEAAADALRLVVDDDGAGLGDTANLFVPFYSTKPDGSGIGLALCRQIAEGHGGSVTLENRPDARGARAVVALPRGSDR